MKLSTSIDEARNAYQRESAYSAYTRSAYGVAGPPATPTGFAATEGNQLITLTWDSQPAADTFEIVYSTSNTFGTAVSLAAGITGTSFTFDSGESIQVGEKYYFWIQATNGAGTSGYAGSVTARSYVTATPPAASVNLTTPTGSWTIGTIIFSQTTLPSGLTINYSSVIREYDGTGWLNLDTFEYEDGVSVSGAFTLTKASGAAFTFWDTEP